MTTLTIQLPDDVLHRLKLLAAASGKSVEEITQEQLSSLAPAVGTPAALRSLLGQMVPISAEEARELEDAIESGRMPADDEGIFDN